jgi:hypothetical protein
MEFVYFGIILLKYKIFQSCKIVPTGKEGIVCNYKQILFSCKKHLHKNKGILKTPKNRANQFISGAFEFSNCS